MTTIRSTHCALTLAAEGTITALDVDPDGGFAGIDRSIIAGAWRLALAGPRLTACAAAGALPLTIRVQQQGRRRCPPFLRVAPCTLLVPGTDPYGRNYRIRFFHQVVTHRRSLV
jgi:hypothetical protein